MKDYITTDECRMRFIDENTPMNVTMLLINQGGVLVKGKITSDNKADFIEWHPMPKRAKRELPNIDTAGLLAGGDNGG